MNPEVDLKKRLRRIEVRADGAFREALNNLSSGSSTAILVAQDVPWLIDMVRSMFIKNERLRGEKRAAIEEGARQDCRVVDLEAERDAAEAKIAEYERILCAVRSHSKAVRMVVELAEASR